MSDQEPTSPPTAETVPYSRFADVTKRKNDALLQASQAEARVKELETELAELGKRAATVDHLSEQVKAMKAEQKQQAAAWAEERAIYQSGITDPEAIDLARYLHSRQPEDGRPAFTEWLTGIKDDPTKAPKALQAYFTPPEPAAAPEPAAPPEPAPAPAAPSWQQQTAPPKPPAPAPAGHQVPSPGAGQAPSSVSPESLRQLRAEAMRTGDYSALQAAQRQALANLGMPTGGKA